WRYVASRSPDASHLSMSRGRRLSQESIVWREVSCEKQRSLLVCAAQKKGEKFGALRGTEALNPPQQPGTELLGHHGLQRTGIDLVSSATRVHPLDFPGDHVRGMSGVNQSPASERPGVNLDDADRNRDGDHEGNQKTGAEPEDRFRRAAQYCREVKERD